MHVADWVEGYAEYYKCLVCKKEIIPLVTPQTRKELEEEKNG